MQINLLSQEIHRHLNSLHSKSFRKGGKLKFSPSMRDAFARCVSDLIAIPMNSHPDEAGDYYVLEVDIEPLSSICEDHEFSYIGVDK